MAVSLTHPSKPLTGTPADKPLIVLDAAKFHPDKIFQVEHHLANHPLLEKSALLKLAKRIPAPGRMRYYSGKGSVDADLKTTLDTHGTGLSLEETLDNIEVEGSWVAFHNVESDPEYKDLVDACLDSVKHIIDPVDPGMYERAGWIFLSSPGAITPYHMDRENNFLMQVRGQKQVCVWDPYDRSVVPEKTLEYFVGNYSPEEVRYKEEYQAKAFSRVLSPGQGVYMPSTGPHTAQTGPDEYSITIAVTYKTNAVKKRATVYRVNYAMRQRGMNPTPYGHSPFADSAKNSVYSAYEGIRRLLKKG